MLPLLLNLALSTSPHTFTEREPAPAPAQPRRDVPQPSPKVGLYFNPLGLLGLGLWAEVDVAVTGGFDVFANVGGGLLGQFGFDVGARYYVLGRPLEGFFLDARFTTFSLPELKLWMGGPGVLVGYSWKFSRISLSVAAGATTFWSFSRAVPTSNLFALNPADADVIILPGITQPFADRPAVQPTVRLAFGPWF